MINFDSQLKIFCSTKINDNNYFSGFGTKKLGDGRKSENIINFFSRNKIVYQKLVVLEQIHSANVEVFDLSQAGKTYIKKIEDTDGVVTKDKKIILSVRTADCIPMIFTDKSAGIIGISHQGWRGSLKKLPIKLIEKIITLGGNKSKINIAIGPSIGPCCYEIDDDRYYSFLEEFNRYSDKIFSVRGEKRYLNLTLLNYLILLDNGMKKEQIDFFPFCTSCNSKKFFSFRRDGKKNYGEMFSFVINRQ